MKRNSMDSYSGECGIIDGDSIVSAGKVPFYRTIENEEYKASINPTGFKRVDRNLPYLYGSDIHFRFLFQNKTDSTMGIYYAWTLNKCDTDMWGPEISRNGENHIDVPPHGKIERDIYVGHLSTMGYYKLHMNLPKFEDTMASFTIVNREAYNNNWRIGLISGVSGALVTLLVSNVSSC